MIKSVEIVNFLSHKLTKLSFSPGVNIIVGLTDSGKSAIIKALKWPMKNRPTGDKFQSHWASKTAVSIETDNNGTITRLKNGSDNQYILDDGKKRMVFKAFKTDVPDEIKEALNFNGINLQTQYDNFYLLKNTPGEVAQHFNRVAHLDKIDIGLKNIDKGIREINSNIKADTTILMGNTEDLEQYVDIGIIEEKIAHLELLELEEIKKKDQENVMTQLVLDVRKITTKIKQESRTLPAEKLVDKLLNNFKKADALNNQKYQLVNLRLDIEDVAVEIASIQTIIPAESLIDSLIDITSQIKEKEVEIEKIQTLLKYIDRVDNESNSILQELKQLEAEFHKNMVGMCPLCGNKIKKS